MSSTAWECDGAPFDPGEILDEVVADDVLRGLVPEFEPSTVASTASGRVGYFNSIAVVWPSTLSQLSTQKRSAENGLLTSR